MEKQQTSSIKNNRIRKTAEIVKVDALRQQQMSERKVAKLLNIPRSTLRDRASKRASCKLSQATQNFLDTEDGMQFIHRVILAVEFLVTQVSHGGLRIVQKFLKMTQLHYWASSSVGSIQNCIKVMEERIITFGNEQEEKLSTDMAEKTISVSVDETYCSSTPCLVALEPVSNYIIQEELTQNRTCETWDKSLSPRLEALPVMVYQLNSDNAKALIQYANTTLGVHHSPDLFHVQQDLVKAIGAVLSRDEKACTKALNKAQNSMDKFKEKPQKSKTLVKENVLKDDLSQAKAKLKEARNTRKQVNNARKNITKIYHPFDINTGAMRSSEHFEKEVRQHVTTIETAMSSYNLSDYNKDKLQKAKNSIPFMTQTIQYFWLCVSTLISSFQLTDDMSDLLKKHILPMVYISLQVRKKKLAKHKDEYRAVVSELKKSLEKHATWIKLSPQERDNLLKKAEQCAELFQRSTSSVEGRNALLSMHHHAYRQMNTRKLKASTVVHNFFIQRPDSTTAAQRFFEKKHDDLFEYVLQKMDYPAEPRIRGKTAA
jgi:predicted XRE-type DNA-binding protein